MRRLPSRLPVPVPVPASSPQAATEHRSAGAAGPARRASGGCHRRRRDRSAVPLARRGRDPRPPGPPSRGTYQHPPPKLAAPGAHSVDWSLGPRRPGPGPGHWQPEPKARLPSSSRRCSRAQQPAVTVAGPVRWGADLTILVILSVSGRGIRGVRASTTTAAAAGGRSEPESAPAP